MDQVEPRPYRVRILDLTQFCNFVKTLGCTYTFEPPTYKDNHVNVFVTMPDEKASVINIFSKEYA
jgi:hypothetical protein